MLIVCARKLAAMLGSDATFWGLVRIGRQVVQLEAVRVADAWNLPRLRLAGAGTIPSIKGWT